MRADALRLTWKKSTLVVLSLFLLFICGLPRHAGAQQVTATINGIVTDPSGHVIQNADVIATDLDRGTTWPTKTNGEGYYHLGQLPVGRYEVRVTAAGFRTAVQSPVELQLNQVAAINMQLVIGQNSETVNVTSEAPLLQADTTQVGTVIDSRTNVDLPLASRNYLQLTLVTPGAVTVSPAAFSSGKNAGEVPRPEINGNRFTANNYVLDGMDNNQMSDNFVGYSPAPDAIQEFNVITQNAPADFGNYMGGIINAAIKSGTNKLHGSIFEFFRNDVLNANEWMNGLDPANPVAKPKLRWNQFGAAVGGPIIKNKLFFFADYQGSRFDRPSTTSPFTVFTALERQGNYSELAALVDSNGNPIYHIKDPLTGQPFPNDTIPTNRLSPAALAILNSGQYLTPANGNLTANAYNTQRSQINTDQGDLKLDYAMSEKDHLMGRFSDLHLNNPTLNTFDLRYNPLNTTDAWNFVVGYTRNISNTMLNDARLGVNYVKIGQNHTTSNFSGNAGSLFGIGGLPTDFLPAIGFSGSAVNGFGTKNSVNDYADTVIQYQDTFSWVHGKHNTRIGFQGWRLRMNGIFPGNGGNAGSISFNGQYSGSAETDFLLGLPSQLQVGYPGPDWGQRGNIFGAFIQDDWKLSSKLTLNLGFRYENHTPWYEAHDKQVNWNPNTGILELPGQNGNPRALYNAYNGIGNYQPRLGIAYQLFDRTVIRAGYSLSSFMEGTGQGLRLPENPPASTDVNIDYRALPYPNSTFDNGFNGLVLPNQCTIAGLQNNDPLCYDGAVLRVWNPKLRPAASNQFNVFIEHELSPTTTFQVGYVGQITKHLTVAENLAMLQLQPNGTLAPSPYFAQNHVLLDPQSQGGFGVLPLATYSDAIQNYNALQISLKGRNNHGLSYLLSYTWAKCLTNSVGFFGEGGQSASQSAWWQNQYDPMGDYGGCYYDVKHNFTGYVIYDLPFGRGRTYGSDMSKVVDGIAGGWRMSVIPTFRDGFPLTISASNDFSGTGTFAPRANCIAPPNVVDSRLTGAVKGIQWFDPASYADPAPGTYGNCSVSSVRGPGEANIDLGLAKSFQIHESQNLEFRAEFLNAFNHPILDAPNTGFGNANFGVIQTSEGARNIQFGLKYNF